MRITLALDDDVLEFARAHAQREHISIGQAVSRLARLGIRAPSAELAATAAPRSRFALLPVRAEANTPEHVRKLMDQEGI
jgi:hypothetical protein